jgi:hypothetical protein
MVETIADLLHEPLYAASGGERLPLQLPWHCSGVRSPSGRGASESGSLCHEGAGHGGATAVRGRWS